MLCSLSGLRNYVGLIGLFCECCEIINIVGNKGLSRRIIIYFGLPMLSHFRYFVVNVGYLLFFFLMSVEVFHFRIAFFLCISTMNGCFVGISSLHWPRNVNSLG